MVDAFKPDYIAPIVGYLTSEANEETSGCLFEIMGGWAAQTRWQKTGGYGFPVNRPLTPEAVISKWAIITNFCEFGVDLLRIEVYEGPDYRFAAQRTIGLCIPRARKML